MIGNKWKNLKPFNSVQRKRAQTHFKKLFTKLVYKSYMFNIYA